MSKKVLAVIPARYWSTRFPGKPLALINGKTMIQWVYEAVTKCDLISDTYVATDDQRIFDAVKAFGGKVVMTSNDHKSGSDRLAEAVNKIDCEADIILNIQGDEPLIPVEMIEQLINSFSESETDVVTLRKEITTNTDIVNPNIAKVITDKHGYAIYFSRSTIPYDRDKNGDVKYYKHIGVYAYSRDFLMKFINMQHSTLEQIEKLEQLRIIENGYKIKVIETKYDSIGVDLPEDIHIVKKKLEEVIMANE